MAQTNPDGVANSVEKITEYLATAMDNVLVAEAKTTALAANPLYVDASSRAKTIKIATADVKGAGDYSASKGWPENSGSLTWQDYTLQYDRGTSFLIDALETDQTGGLVSASLMASEFLRTKLVPEIDAVRIAKAATAASAAGNSDTTIPTKAKVFGQIVEALDTIYDNTGIDSGVTVFVNTKYRSVLNLAEEYTRVKSLDGTGDAIQTRVQSINGNPIVFVPSARMVSQVTTKDGVTTGQEDGGFEGAGNEVSFLAVAPQCAQGIVAYSNVTVLPKGSHTRGDGDFWAYRVYHDCIIPKNRAGGIYVSLGEAL